MAIKTELGRSSQVEPYRLALVDGMHIKRYLDKDIAVLMIGDRGAPRLAKGADHGAQSVPGVSRTLEGTTAGWSATGASMPSDGIDRRGHLGIWAALRECLPGC